MSMHLLPITLAGLTLGGCALGPPVVTPNDHLPAAFEASAAAPAADADLSRWWDVYHDAELTGLVETALAHAPDARIAMARLAEALAVRGGALSAFAPQGGLSASAVRTSTQLVSGVGTLSLGSGVAPISVVSTGANDSYQAAFNVSWELDLFGRARAARQAADADLSAARFAYAAARVSLVANVADQLFLIRGLNAEAEEARQTARIERRRLAAAGDRAAAGVDRPADEAAIQSEAETAEARVTTLEDQAAAARRTLLVLIGRGTDPLASLQSHGVLVSPPVPATAPGELLRRRPDVREAAARLAAATGQLHLDERALFPRFTLLPGVGIAATPGLEGQTTTSFWSIGLGLAQPILDLPRLKSVIRAQGARADQASLSYEKAVQTAYGETEMALAGLKADQARLDRLAAAERHARTAFDAANDRYAAGVEDISVVLVFERTWRGAAAALIDGRLQACRRSVQVFKAIGGGWA